MVSKTDTSQGVPIRTRLCQGLCIIIALATLGGGINLYLARQASAVTNDLLTGPVSARAAADRALSSLLQFRYHESQFLALRDQSQRASAQTALTKTYEALQQIEAASSSPALSTTIEQAESVIADHEAIFNKLAKLTIERGLDENSGLEGRMRSAVHAIEKDLRKTDFHQLRELMLMSRRHEKDYIMRGDNRYIDLVKTRINAFNKSAQLFQVNQDQATRWAAHWADYLEAIEKLGENYREKRELRSELDVSITLARELLNEISSQTYQTAQQAEAQVSSKLIQLQSISLAVIAAMVIAAISVAIILTRSITRPIETLQKWVKTVADGQSFHGLSKSGWFREIKQLGDSFLRMADQIQGREEDLLQLNNELEERVKSRTRQLAEAADNAKRANDVKSQFLANMSHEIRTPMNAILGYTDLLSEHLEDATPEAVQALHTIQSNAQHLLAVINDILDVSAIEAGKLTIKHHDFNPAQVVDEALSLSRPMAQAKGIELSVVCEPGVPSRANSDPVRIKQILTNLVGNAIKFTEAGSVTVRVEADKQTKQIRFHVTDTGIGMTEAQRQKLLAFDTFTQADTGMNRRFGGSGLGLHISNVMAQALGGTIQIKSTIGQGSTFTAIIANMANDPAQRPAIPSEDKSISESTTPPLQGTHVLVAEDGPDNQRLFCFHLKKAGAKVTLCENGLIAAETIENAGVEDQPDIVLMDMQMPELDGYSATRRLRAGGCKLPIIALTAHAMTGDREKCIEAGCNDYYTKPIKRDDLIKACLSMLPAKQSQTAA